MDINDIRKEIDIVDDEITKLFLKRMQLTKDVAMQKKDNSLALENPERERQILVRVTKEAEPELKLYTKMLFETLFDTSKAYQSRMLESQSNIKQAINDILEKGLPPFPLDATVACQGVAGAYSSIAATKLFPIANTMYFKNFDAVFAAVEKGLCEFGVLPIENSSAGSVSEVYDLMRKHRFHIARAVRLPVQHYLLAKKGVKAEELTEIVSHSQAISQCSEYLKQHPNVSVTICDNTAAAAKLVAESDSGKVAAIASRECAALYGLCVIASNIQNNSANFTRFIAIEKDLNIYEGSQKISIAASLPHEAGSLNKLLNKFSALGLNLTKLESRPLENTPFEFAFYFDFLADIGDTGVQNLLSELENSSDAFLFLGSYHEVV